MDPGCICYFGSANFLEFICSASVPCKIAFWCCICLEVNSGLRILLLDLDLFAFECSVRLFFVYDFSSNMLAKIIKQFQVNLGLIGVNKF